MLAYITQLEYVDLQAHAGYKLNTDVIEHIKQLPQSFFVHFDSAYTNQQINHDANDLIIFGIISAVQITQNTLLVISIGIVLFKASVSFGFVCIGLGFVSGALYLVFRRKLFANSFDMQEQTAHFFSSLQEQLDKIDFIRRHALRTRFSAKLASSFEEFYQAVLLNQRANAAFAFNNGVVRSASQVCLLVVGIIDVARGSMEPGFLVTAISYYSSFCSAMQYALTFGKSYQEARVCFERLMRIMDIPAEQNGSICPKQANELVCEGVSFSYPGASKRILSHLNIHLKSGVIYGIAGENGCGKSSLLSVLLGMYPDETDGCLAINGVNYGQMNRYEMRRSTMGLTEQEPPILVESVIENLKLMAPESSEGDVRRYCDELGLSGFVSKLPQGMETLLDEQNSNISGGEKQKIAIIRQLLMDPAVMLFDEPTSALDEKSKWSFIRLLHEKRNGHIIVVVSHDKCMLDACDEVIRIDKKMLELEC